MPAGGGSPVARAMLTVLIPECPNSRASFVRRRWRRRARATPERRRGSRATPPEGGGKAKGRSAAGRCGRACPRCSVLGFRSFESARVVLAPEATPGLRRRRAPRATPPEGGRSHAPPRPGAAARKRGSVAESGLCRFAVLPCRRALRSALLLREGPGGCRASRRRPAASQARAQERTVGP